MVFCTRLDVGEHDLCGFCWQAQSDDDDVGPDDVAVNVDGGSFMEEFFEQVMCIDNDWWVY